MRKNGIITTCACLLIGLFLYTAVYKLAGFQAYERSMRIQPLPKWSIVPLIWIVPISEIIASILLFIPRTMFYGFLFSAVLMLSFTGYVGLVLVNTFGRIPCTCGGVIETMNWSQHLIFNSVFFTIAMVGLFLVKRRERLLRSGLI